MKRPDADRWAVVTHRRAGRTPAEIVRLTGFGWTFVTRWVRAADNDERIEDKPGRGRPRTITPSVVAKITKKIKLREHQSVRTVARQVGVSRESVRRAARANLYPYHRPKRPLLTEDHKRRRRAFARKFARHDWQNTLFTDEKWFSLWPLGNSKNNIIWAENASQVPPRRRVAQPPRFMVWGGITYYGTIFRSSRSRAL
jgi:transposase